MTPTSDISPPPRRNSVAAEVASWPITIRVILLAVLPAIGSALVGYGKGERVDSKAEAGFYWTRADVEALKMKIVSLEIRLNTMTAEVSTLKRTPRVVVSSKKALPPVQTLVTPPAPPPPAPTPLPVDLNQALEKTEQAK